MSIVSTLKYTFKKNGALDFCKVRELKHYRYIPFPVDWDVTPPTRSRKKERYIKYRSWRGGSHNIDRSDVYEIKYMDGLKLLTENDKGKSGQGKKITATYWVAVCNGHNAVLR